MTDTLSEPVSVARMTAHYDGEALRNHEIDVRRLSPALMGLAVAFERTQAHVNPDYQIRLNAKATSSGSVIIDLIIRITNDAVSLLSSNDVTATVNAMTIGSYVFSGMRMSINSIKHGGKPKKAEPREKSRSCFEYPDGYQEVTYDKSLDLIGDPTFVQGIKDATSPALSPGIDLVEFHLPNVSESVDTEEAEAISDYDVSDSDTSTASVEMVIQALNPSFLEDGKWRITDGIKKQFVSLEDRDFEKKVLDSRESLRANDTYKVIMRVEKKIDSKHLLSTRYIAIEKVLEHRHLEEQGSLF